MEKELVFAFTTFNPDDKTFFLFKLSNKIKQC